MFTVDDVLPLYNGPISTSLDEEIAEKFSRTIGLVWTIQPSYENQFKLVLGMNVFWISCHPDEREVMLMNQYLPINSTYNFDNHIANNVDHLLQIAEII